MWIKGHDRREVDKFGRKKGEGKKFGRSKEKLRS
jgi:hypothetical protein